VYFTSLSAADSIYEVSSSGRRLSESGVGKDVEESDGDLF